jgi:hypothetical protein
MGRYLALWEADYAKIPLDLKERKAGWAVLLDMVKQDMKKGLIKEYGVFVGVPNGFSIMEGTEVEVSAAIQNYIPFFFYKVYPIASIDQVEQVIKGLSK